MDRTLFLHCGLHKTGSTAIQTSFARHRSRLKQAGLLYPETGDEQTGHHNLAWEKTGDDRFDNASLTFDSLRDQVASFDGDVVLSSEDFETLLDRALTLHDLISELRASCRRQVCPIVYIRSGQSYAVSLYLELLAHGYARTFSEFRNEIRSTRQVRFRSWIFQFDSDRIRATLASLGTRFIERDYDEVVHDQSVLTDFLRVLGRPAGLLGPELGPKVNQRRPEPEFVALFVRNRLGRELQATELDVIEKMSGAAGRPSRRWPELAQGILLMRRLPLGTRMHRLFSGRTVEVVAELAGDAVGQRSRGASERALAAWCAGL